MRVKLWPLGFVCTVALAAPARAQDPYSDAWVSSEAHEQVGDCAAAIISLQPLRESFDQDYALRLRLGWLNRRCERWPQAEEHYRAALALSDGAAEAKHGLAWVLHEQGRPDEAHTLFEELSTGAPNDPDSALGLAATKPSPAFRFRPRARATAHVYTGHVDKDVAVGGLVGFGGVLFDTVTVDATYRYTQFFMKSTTTTTTVGNGPGEGPGPGGQTTTQSSGGSVANHEAFGSVGLAFDAWAARLHYAAIIGEAGGDLTGHVLGASGCGTLPGAWGAVGGEASYSLYDERNIALVRPWWRIPIGDTIAVIPAAQVQWGDLGPTGMGFLGVEVRGQLGSLAVGGKLGEELQSAYLDLPVVYNTPEAITYGAWAEAALHFGDGWRLALAYELNHFGPDPSVATARDSFQHLLTFTFDRGAP